VVTVPATMPPVTTMTTVHEHVHHWAGQQQQERQCAKEVGAVLAQQKVRGDGAEHEQADRIPGAPERRRPVLLGLVSRLSRMSMVVIHLKPPKVQSLCSPRLSAVTPERGN
jgi:hypothetical protein